MIIKFPSNPDNKEALKDVLDELNNDNKSIDHSIQMAYWLRNVLSHDFGWNVRIKKEEYQDLYLIVILSCLHVINCLWRKNPCA